MTDKSRKLTSLVSAGVLATGVALPAMAADNSTSKAQDTAKEGQTQAAETQIPDTKVKSFAEAAEDVQSIAKEYRPQIKAAKQNGKNKKAQQHAMDAQKDMRKAIQDQDGISVKEYRSITNKARKDKNLSKRIHSEMDSGKSGNSES